MQYQDRVINKINKKKGTIVGFRNGTYLVRWGNGGATEEPAKRLRKDDNIKDKI